MEIPGTDTIVLTVEPIHMTDIGSDSKVDLAILTGMILTDIATSIAKQGEDILPENITESLSDALIEEALKEDSDLGKAIQGLFKKKEE